MPRTFSVATGVAFLNDGTNTTGVEADVLDDLFEKMTSQSTLATTLGLLETVRCL